MHKLASAREWASAFKVVLDFHHDVIAKHISTAWASRNTKGIEKAFIDALLESTPGNEIRREVDLASLGGRQMSRGGVRGRMDCVVEDATGLEFKAMRLPRKIHLGASGARYDLGQIVEDYCRVHEATLLRDGFVIVCIYGPLVADAETDGQLYRAFHNQLYADYAVSTAEEPMVGAEWKRHRQATQALGFDHPHHGAAVPSGLGVARSQTLGVVVLPVHRP